MAEIGDGKGLAADDEGEVGDLLVREGEEGFEDAELVHDVEGGGMDGVAAEVAKEVFVFFEDGDVDALAGEEEAEHDAGRASADDAAGSAERSGGGGHLADERNKGVRARQKEVSIPAIQEQKRTSAAKAASRRNYFGSIRLRSGQALKPCP
jgi:hypothetical protein